MSRSLGEASNPLEIRHHGDAADIEGVLADPFVARLRSLNVIHAGERVFVGRPLTQTGPDLGGLLVRAERLEQGFLRVNRNRASAAGGRAGGALRARLADGRGEVHRYGTRSDRRGLFRGTG